jgi:hypothetical protein
MIARWTSPGALVRQQSEGLNPAAPVALQVRSMCNLYSITTNQAAIIALFRVMNRYVGNLPPPFKG